MGSNVGIRNVANRKKSTFDDMSFTPAETAANQKVIKNQQAWEKKNPMVPTTESVEEYNKRRDKATGANK